MQFIRARRRGSTVELMCSKCYHTHPPRFKDDHSGICGEPVEKTLYPVGRMHSGKKAWLPCGCEKQDEIAPWV